MNTFIRPEARRAMLGACVFAVVGFASVSVALAFAAESREGTIGRIADDHFVLNIETIEEIFHWGEETSVTLNGEAVELSQLNVGDSVAVTFNLSDDGTMFAMNVEAMRP